MTVKLTYINNVKRQEFEPFTCADEDCIDKIRQKIVDSGYLFDESKLSLEIESNVATAFYSEVIAPNNSWKPYDCKFKGISFFFHTDESRHKNDPHVHAEYEGKEIKISLNDFSFVGRFKNTRKQNTAIKFVRKHKEELMADWNSLIVDKGSPPPKRKLP